MAAGWLALMLLTAARPTRLHAAGPPKLWPGPQCQPFTFPWAQPCVLSATLLPHFLLWPSFDLLPPPPPPPPPSNHRLQRHRRITARARLCAKIAALQGGTGCGGEGTLHVGRKERRENLGWRGGGGNAATACMWLRGEGLCVRQACGFETRVGCKAEQFGWVQKGGGEGGKSQACGMMPGGDKLSR